MIDRPGRLVLLGHPVSHSLSPHFQNAALRASGIPLEYELLDVRPDELRSVVEALKVQHAFGNVTIPHKGAMLDLCADASPLARRVGAVNTFWLSDGALTGDNTDVAGFDALLDSIARDERFEGAALIGAGGAAAAAIVALEHRGTRVRVFNRTLERARALADRFAPVAQVATSIEEAVDGATLVLNATPPGEHAAAPALDLASRGAVFVDLAYAPGGTPWSREATRRGYRAADGLEMLLVQGARAFECWFGFAPDLETMRRALHAAARA
jgi:shikimate dehydrogenase